MKMFQRIKNITWSLIIAFMVGVHNFYHQEYNSPDDLKRKIECVQKFENINK